MALVSVVIEYAFFHIPSNVVYGRLTLLTASSSRTETLIAEVGCPAVPMDDEQGQLMLKMSALLEINR